MSQPQSLEPHPTFVSKRDAWIVVVIWGGVFLCLAAALLPLPPDAPGWLRPVLVVTLLPSAAFMLWVLHDTRYVFSGEALRIRCGPFRWHVPFTDVESVSPSRNPGSSPACSLDRLMIRWAENRSVLISPEPREAFLHAFLARCPQLERRGDSLTRRGD